MAFPSSSSSFSEGAVLCVPKLARKLNGKTLVWRNGEMECWSSIKFHYPSWSLKTGRSARGWILQEWDSVSWSNGAALAEEHFRAKNVSGCRKSWGILWRRNLSRLTDCIEITPSWGPPPESSWSLEGWKSLFSTFCTLTLSYTMLSAPANSRLCTKLPRARWTIGLTPKAILYSYSQSCPDGLFILLFYSSLPEQSPAPFLAFTQITFITCRESKISPVLQHSSCFTSVDLGAAADSGSASPDSSRTKPSPWSPNSLTVTISFLHSPSAFLPMLVPASLGREETCIRELCKQPVLLSPITQQCWAASGTMYGIQEAPSLGCAPVAPGASSGGVTACQRAGS